MSTARTPITFWLDLDGLDEERATFKHFGPAKSLSGFWLDREMWADMGRPGRIEITPNPEPTR